MDDTPENPRRDVQPAAPSHTTDIGKISEELSLIKAWLGSEFGYQSPATGNLWRVIHEQQHSLERLNDIVWKGNGRPSLQDQIGQVSAKLNVIGALAVVISPMMVLFIELVLASIIQ